mgnify:CR=1 FL=1
MITEINQTSRPSASVAQLNARHEAMMLRLLDGVTPRQVSAEFFITESSLSLLRSSTVWKQVEAKLRDERRQVYQNRLNGLADKAITALEETVVDTDPRVKLQSAREILNRTGFNPAIKVEQELVGNINLYLPKHFQTQTQTQDAEFSDITGDTSDDVST